MISHSHKFIFIWPMKTAGSSINIVLYKYGLHKFGDPNTRTRLGNKIKHLKARELREMKLYKKFWNDYFKFGFVRNPWDLLVSLFFYKKQNDERYQKMTFNKFILQNKFASARKNYNFTSCYDRFADTNGKLIVNFIGKFERLQHDFNKICKKIGIKKKIKLPHIRRTRHNKYRTYYNDATKKHVTKVFAKDIEYFKYRF